MTTTLASPRSLAARRFRRNRLALAGAVFLTAVGVLALAAPLVAGHDPNAVDLAAFREPPSAAHLLGTDSSGRDVFARLVYAGRVSLLVGLLSSLAAVALGTLLGALAGMFGGPVDAAVMRAADVVLSFPSLVVVVVLAGVLGPGAAMLVLVFAACNWPTACRVVRGLTLSLREREYVQAARAFGAGRLTVIGRHVLPAVLPHVAVAGTLLVAQLILLEAVLSFLGLGVRPPHASWGNMLTDAQNLTLIQTMPWLWLPPGLAIALTVLAVNFVGDGLRDAVDPKEVRG
ncbi:oligopeptide ABC transporter permease [Nonomuraea jabiensis]|uniref:Peptide/nickel transport system permease protein n=1 Tax=Nonomuraea jabiensis TaxID=882448 RepID=A0A7W9GF08_9ACTN|nr:oligopeptide ABC transporter permease [Nonomuraea jabiensis]MBB5782614.1 peptide/nickel transport system permease protein [Nonomuraea jabiensis]